MIQPEQLTDAATKAIFKCDNEYLRTIEVDVLEACLAGLTYEEMAEKLDYSNRYIAGDIAPALWAKLTRALDEKVSKSNLRVALERLYQRQPSQEKRTSYCPYPEGPVPLKSLFYINRSEIEHRCSQIITNPGTLIRIKAAKGMGKTSLVNRILKTAEAHPLQTLYLDFRWASQASINDLERFLRWFCFQMGRQLGLDNQLDDYWDTELLTSIDNCSQYFEDYLLPNMDASLVLALDSVEQIFPYPEVAGDVLRMLRSWHEKSKSSAIWEKVRLVITHATEDYVSLDINHSPLTNVGEPIALQPFGIELAQELAARYELQWPKLEVESLHRKVGGHPYLIHLALYKGAVEGKSCQEILETSDQEIGIYFNHLLRLREELIQSQELTAAYLAIANSPQGIELNSLQIYHLQSLGLVKLKGNLVLPSCSLYQQYFQRELNRDAIA
ncbi:AAA-like domain-containing protein [Acaryochloris marina NIES-2412]|uniref:AAA-like domain-containing protein n=1 Tax=Acaryochloris marina TaxID=155978 RepID=UPI004057F61D